MLRDHDVGVRADKIAHYPTGANDILSPGEGWGRPHVEAMAMELPVIATNWSGPTEFMTEENSYPLPIEPELVPVGKGASLWHDPTKFRLYSRISP